MQTDEVTGTAEPLRSRIVMARPLHDMEISLAFRLHMESIGTTAVTSVLSLSSLHRPYYPLDFPSICGLYLYVLVFGTWPLSCRSRRLYSLFEVSTGG